MTSKYILKDSLFWPNIWN